ncbi:MAG: hypothetical protein KBF12_00035 [Sebaldella sp.]|nr:hypothetical protein [Sebaldella sp.]
MSEERTESEHFEMFYEKWKDLSIGEMHEKIMGLFVAFTKKEPPKSMSKDYTERDYLEVSIEALGFIHCLVYGIDYPTFKDNEEEFDKLEKNNKLLWHLIKLKAEKFREEVLKENGMELIGKVGENYVITDHNKYN